MNKTKKLHLGLLAITIIALFSCKSKKSEEQISLTVKTPTLAMTSIANPNIKNSSDFLQIAIEKFNKTEEGKNVNITLEVFDYLNEADAITNSYGTPNAVDVLYEGYFNMSSYISTGNVVPLDDIITYEIRKDISESSWKQSRKNGKTYMMPFLSMQNVLAYNKELFRECGLEKYISSKMSIQNWTIEEWEYILDTLAEKLPIGTFPTMMYAENNQGDTHIMSFIRAFGSTIFDDDGNFNFQDPKAIRALKWIQDGVSRGWYMPHSENLAISDNSQLFFAGRLGIFIVNNESFSYDDNFEERFGLVNFPNNIATSFITGFEIFDNGDEKKLKAAKNFLRFIYEDYELMDLSAGSLPESKRVSSKFVYDLLMADEFAINSDNVIDFMNSTLNWQGNPNSVRNVFYPHIHDLLMGIVTPEECAKALDEDCNAAIRVDAKYHD